ncbi:MAG: hypothetical protein Q9225_002876 [Loekoesia sp. 1 TL-2023]
MAATAVGDDVASAKSPDGQSPPRPDKADAKAERQPYLDQLAPLQTPFRPSSDDNASIYSADLENEPQRGRLLVPPALRYHSLSPTPTQPWRVKCSTLWTANKGLVLVLVAQLFGALMNVTTRLLETSGEPLNTFQVMFARTGITLVMGTVYMWWAEVDGFPFGPKEVRKLLMARGFGGFFGRRHPTTATCTSLIWLTNAIAVFGIYCMLYFLLVAGFVSLLGVVLIARPTSFSLHSGYSATVGGARDALPAANATYSMQLEGEDSVKPAQRLIAIGVALFGVLGAACAYTTIRWIGQRAHPLISVNYFAAWTTFVATVVLLFVPEMHFKLPSGLKQWSYLIFLGVCGFVMQLLLTTGLAYEKSSRATNMVYTQMLFALAFDKLVFDTTLGALSILGSSLILGSALYIAVRQNSLKNARQSARIDGDEEDGLMATGDASETTTNVDRRPMRGVQEVQLRTMRV